jgi:TRAP-type C4-dicarboxylate transport system substrate-binding protein
VVVNTDALNALKPAHRAALLGSVDEALAFYVDNYNNKTTGAYAAEEKKAGLTMVTFTPAQTAKLLDMAESVRAEWVSSNAKNFDSKALFDFTKGLFNK